MRYVIFSVLENLGLLIGRGLAATFWGAMLINAVFHPTLVILQLVNTCVLHMHALL